MSEQIAQLVGDAMATVMETIVQTSRIEEGTESISALVLTGAVAVGDQIYDFGVNIADKDKQLVSTYFVHQNEDPKHMNQIGKMVNDYFTEAGANLTTWSHSSVPSLADSNLEK